MDLNEALRDLVKVAVSDALQPLLKNLEISKERGNSANQESLLPYFNLNSAAKYLNITRQCLTTYMKNGVVKAYRLNGNPRFKKSDLDSAMTLIDITLRKHK